MALPTVHIRLKTKSGTPASVVPEDDNKTFKRIGTFLVSMLKSEYMGKKEQIGKLNAKDALDQLKNQLLSYSKGVWPFNLSYGDSDDPMSWWKPLTMNPDAQVLAVCLFG